MSVAAEMMPDWKQWEGATVEGFLLKQLLGEGDKSAVFRTQLSTGDAAIKFVPARGAQANRLIEQWSRVSALRHPHLIAVLKSGTFDKGGASFAYLVTDFAQENLAEVLKERALSERETLELLQPAAQALAYLHERGLVHGSLKPSNFLAQQDRLKLSSDAACPGDAVADMRALAGIIIYALTQCPADLNQGDAGANLIQSLPEPFREISRNCLGHPEGQKPWSATQLLDWLQERVPAPSAPTPAPRTKSTGLRPTSYAIILGLIMVALVTVGSLIRNRTSGPPPVIAPAAISRPVQQTPAGPAPSVPHREPPIATKAPATQQSKTSRAAVSSPDVDSRDGVIQQILPDIPDDARRTVRGTATVVVKVTVAESGDVTDAKMEPGGSRYFGRLAAEAARKWRFTPGGNPAPRELRLRFDITQAGTTATVEKSTAR